LGPGWNPAIIGVAITGILVDWQPRALIHASVKCFAAAALLLIFGHASRVAVIVASILWR